MKEICPMQTVSPEGNLEHNLLNEVQKRNTCL